MIALAVALAVLAGTVLIRLLLPVPPDVSPGPPLDLAAARAGTDWRQVKDRFGLSALEVADAQHLLGSSTRFEKGHLLHDLAADPGHAERAFGLIALNPDLGRLTEQLRGLAIGSRPFPDSAFPPTETRFSSDSFADLVVFSIVERLHEQRSNPRAGSLLAALRDSPRPGPPQR